MADTKAKPCSYCGGEATLKCPGCESRYYCGAGCQRSDLTTHETMCSDTAIGKAVERIADTLLKAYLQFRENTYDSPVKKVKVKAKGVIIYDAARKEGVIFHDFPDDMVRQEDVKVKNAMLCFLMCNEPLGYLYEMIEVLFAEFEVQLEELSVTLKDIPCVTTVIQPCGSKQDNSNYHHEVLRVTSIKTKKAWVIDMAGSQYGLTKSCRRWEEFKSKHIKQVLQVHAFGTNRSFVDACSQIEGNPGLLHGVGKDAAEHLIGAFNDWVKGLTIDIPTMMRLDDEAFNFHQGNVLNGMDTAVRKFVKGSDYSGKARVAARYERGHPMKSTQEQVELGGRIMGMGLGAAHESNPLATNDPYMEQVRQMMGSGVKIFDMRGPYF